MSTTGEANSGDIRPIVPTGGGNNLGLWAFIIALPIGGIVLANALYQGGEDTTAPGTSSQPIAAAGQISSPPPLALPAQLLEPVVPVSQPRVVEQPAVRVQPVQPAPSFVRPPPAPVPSAAPEVTLHSAPRPEVVFERRFEPLSRADAEAATEPDVARITASRLANPSMTIPQGTIIPAVLETALDSTRGGAARALVQRDIHSFDGSRVLIPRGSRLYGSYEAGINAGERRALVIWTRLIRPDGVTMALDSPSSDPLGRAGIEGEVDSHFWERFGGAILQSVLDIGVGVATREASGNGVYVALPGATQTVTQSTQQQQIRPVLRVDHGTSVSVFVAHDLDFSDVES